ncbi:MAG: methanol--corrinoid methyltransferase, partial [Candidatus Aminicenantes bacterium]|nr:methanol--corrinoid methyltransferase [Candidatus Aminicenantes bacterium]
MRTYKQLTIQEPSKLLFGNAPFPLTTRRGLIIGGGQVYPELNFTVPPMTIDEATFPDIKKMYKNIISEACQRAVELENEGFVAEFETLLEMTQNPTYAVELTKIMNEVMDDYHEKYGLKSALRVTPNDLREMERPQRMRSGPLLEKMLETFERCS